MTKILAIETSCDETAAAIIEDGRYIRSNVVATQIDLHRRFGGIFPEVASRQHVLSIQPVIEQALTEANVDNLSALDAIAVTHGPGLSGSLLVGVNAAKGMSFASGLPLLPVNHLEGHIYSNWLITDSTGDAEQSPDRFPALHLIVSGGHTELILMRGHGDYERLGGTLDDAAGEAFDKVARLLNLGFPGGPAIQRAAMTGDATVFDIPRPLIGTKSKQKEHRFNFSFSGLKTAMLNLIRQLKKVHGDENWQEPQRMADIAAGFQQAVVDVLVKKTVDAAQAYNVAQVCICGGVSANALLREQSQAAFAALGIPCYIPPLFLCTDNAAMIGAAAYYRWQQTESQDTLQKNSVDTLALDVYANLPLT
ncbi:MAG: tRNA (adenosine(37)-N6)-threonylcarbamoyltransferase complex transferase subunit TsaD [Chloroflexota bacterium]